MVIGAVLGIISSVTGTSDVQAAASSAVCEKAIACCQVINPEGSKNAQACDALKNVPEESCKASLKGFRNAVKVKAPKKLSVCK